MQSGGIGALRIALGFVLALRLFVSLIGRPGNETGVLAVVLNFAPDHTLSFLARVGCNLGA